MEPPLFSCFFFGLDSSSLASGLRCLLHDIVYETCWITTPHEGLLYMSSLLNLILISGTQVICSVHQSTYNPSALSYGVVGAEVEVLVCMGGFSIDSGEEGAIIITLNQTIEEWQFLVLLHFICELKVASGI